MNKRKITKLVIDILLGLLYVFLLGYAFTGGLFHEVAGIIFAVMVVIHNISNIGWFKTLKMGQYNTKRKTVFTLNFMLTADVAAILVTGILNSRYLFHSDIRAAWIGRIHATLALIGFVLIFSHVLVHVFSHTKRKYRKLPIVLIVSVSVFAVAMNMWILPYLERHFVTVEVDLDTVISGESVDFDGRKIVTVYFTRVGNTDFEDDVDAVSGASLLLNGNREFMGNGQVLALMIQDAVGGDIISINTKERYPSSYSDTISVASEELKRQDLPELINMPEDLSEYDTVFLVYPLWWYTIPKPVEAFLSCYDFSGKTVIPIVTHGGSGAGKSVEDIMAICNGTVMAEPLEIYCGDIPYCREGVAEWLKGLSI